MANYVTSDIELGAVADAIRAKAETSGQLVYPAGFVSAIENIETKPKAKNDVTYYDYDGSVIESYTAAEFALLENHPALPTNERLSCQGWNWTLSDAKNFVEAHGGICIGAVYTTNDGKTRIYIHLDEPLQLTIPFNYVIDGTATIDWGDESAETVTGSETQYKSHVYAATGDYVITVNVVSGTLKIGAGGSYGAFQVNGNNTNVVVTASVQGIEIGDNTELNKSALNQCRGLKYITIPNGCTDILQSTFSQCTAIKHITIPATVTTLGAMAFFSCGAANIISLPNSLTSVGTSVFNQCFNMTEHNDVDAILPELSQHNNCYNLMKTSIPGTATIIDQTAYGTCFLIKRVTIPASVTQIGQSAFSNCLSLTEIEIPSGVTSIGNWAFNSCGSLKEIHMKPTTPPTLGSDVFSFISTDAVFYVPSGSLSAYQNATNWSSYANKMVEEE